MAKKIFFILFPLFSLCLFLAKSSFALDPVANPGPPIGVPCGNTICLPNEVCQTTQSQQHCVPVPIDTTKLPDCNDVLGAGQGTFPPNNKCWNHFTNTQTDLTLYKQTCIYEPIASYGDNRTLNGGSQSFSKCGKGTSGPGGPAAPGGNDPACDVHMLVNTDVSAAQIGSYGPDTSASSQYSTDFLAQNYLYNSLFDRPMDLSNTNREAYRTYWRLLPASNQANLRSFVMNMANENQIENIHFDFTKANGATDKTDFKSLYNGLKAQVIVFLHWPFTRIGCLTDYPVCPEYAQATKELDENFRNSYSAFVPLDFDSVRGYIVKRKDDIEQSAYDKYAVLRNDTANGFNGFRLTNVSAENLPYVGAIYQGLLSPKFGMAPALQPQWLVDKYTTGDDLLSNYKMGNTPESLPEVKIAHRNFLDQLQIEASAIVTDPLGWLGNKITSFFDPNADKPKGYTANKTDNIKDNIVEQYANMQMCPMPVSYHLLSPKTADKYLNPTTGEEERPDDHHQIITIPGNQLDWSYTPKCETINVNCSINPITNLPDCRGTCHEDADTYIDGNQCCTRAWSVSGTKHGKALTVLNNPKQTDIKQVVAGNDNISMYKMLLPDGSSPIPNAEIDAPIAQHKNTSGNGLVTAPEGNGLVTAPEGNGLVTAPEGKGTVLNPAESIMRENNLAQDSMHYLQNCWTVPQDQQNSPRCTPLTPITPANCNTDPILEPIPSCKISNNTLNLPDTLIKGIETAAKTFGVPPSLIIGIIYGEGSLNPGSQLFDDTFVTENFKSCAVLPDCSPNANVINNVVPFFPAYWNNLKDAVKTLDPSREPNACNLLDGIFAVAKDLSQGQYGSGAFAGKSCFGIPLNAGSGGSHSCVWDESDVETAIRVWEFGTAYSNTLSCATKQNSCLLGGGVAAQCPAGDDNCEKKSVRYPSQPSHNACVWDIYTAN